MKLFVPYLFLTVMVEWVGYIIVQKKLAPGNHFLYNIYVPLSVLFYLYQMQAYTGSGRFRKLAMGMGLFYLVTVITGFLFFFSILKFVNYNFIIGGFMVSAFAFLYYYDLLEKEDRVTIYSTPAFWINTGLLLYYLPKIIFYTCFEYFAYINVNPVSLHILFFRLNRLFVIILYGCIIINFLCTSRKVK